MNKTLLRKIFLWGVILGDIAMLVFWWLAGQFIFFWTFVAITLSVIVGEILSVVLTGKTLSTNVTKTLQQYKQKRIWIYLALIFLGVSIGSLIVHLSVW